MRSAVNPPCERPTLALLHSSAASARQWDTLAQALSAHFDVHPIDLHGHGQRAPWAGPAALTLTDEAAPVDALIARRGAIHLVGHSYGGAVALDVARRHPQAVRSVAVYEPVLFGLVAADPAGRDEAEHTRTLAAGLREQVARGETAAAGERFVDFWSGAGAWARLSPPRQAAVAARMASVALQFDAAFGAPDPRPALAGVPLLALTGARTVAVTRRIGELLEAALPHAEHARLPSLGHLGPITDPGVVDARLTDFLLRQVLPARRGSAASPAVVPQP